MYTQENYCSVQMYYLHVPCTVTKKMHVVYFYFYFFFPFSCRYRFDFDSQAISPPAHDDSFFYIRYPTGVTNDKKQYSARGLSSITDAITTTASTTETKPIKHTNEGATNMVQHTEPCKKFLNNKDRGNNSYRNYQIHTYIYIQISYTN